VANAKIVTEFRARDRMSGSIDQMAKKFKKLALVVGGVFAAKTVVNWGKDIMGAAYKMEAMTARFQPFLGSALKAGNLMQMLQDTAATTPFQIDQIADAAERLLPIYGENFDELIKMERMIGDLSAGSGDRLKGITEALVKVKNQGKLTMEELKTFVGHGLPIFDELAITIGVATNKIADLSSKGRLSYQMLEDTIRRMTGNTGKYFNAMRIASETFLGKKSTFLDTFFNLKVTIGKPFLGASGAIMDDLTSSVIRLNKYLLDNPEKLEELHAWILRVWGAFRSFGRGLLTLIGPAKVFLSVVSTLVQSRLIRWLLITKMGFAALRFVMLSTGKIMLGMNGAKVLGGHLAALAGKIKIITIAQKIWNLAMSKSPLFTIISIITLVVAGIIYLSRNTKIMTTIFNGFVTGIKASIEWIKNAVSSIGLFFKALGQSVWNFILTPIEMVFKLLGKLPGSLGETFRTAQGHINSLKVDDVQWTKIKPPDMVYSQIGAAQTSGKMSTNVTVKFQNSPEGMQIYQRNNDPSKWGGVSLYNGDRKVMGGP